MYTMLFNSKAYILSKNMLGVITDSNAAIRRNVLEKAENIKILENIVTSICSENITVKFIDDLDNASLEKDSLIEKLDTLSKETDINIDIKEQF